MTVNTFVEPCVRIVELSGSRREANQPRYSNWFMFGYASDAIFRLSLLFFSIGQLVLVGSDAVAKCSKDKPELAYDANWLKSLATVQLLFLPTFFLWSHFAVLDLKPDEQ